MNVNVSAIMKALAGDGKPADARTLELRVGQIVRGVLLEALEGGEALLQINGVHVRARLEAELQVGKGTLLQVQPDSSGGQIVLKPLADAGELLADEALQNVVKSFGMPDQKWSFELLQGLKRDGYPIDKTTAAWFKQAADVKPADVDAGEWMNAAGVAYRRGLAPTETTIASLRQALYGEPVHAGLNRLQALLADFLAQPQDMAAPASGGSAREAASRAAQLLAQGQALLAEGGDALLAEARPAAAQPQSAAQAGAARQETAPQGGQPQLASAQPAETSRAGGAAAAPDAGRQAAAASPQAAEAARRLAQPEAATAAQRGPAAGAPAEAPAPAQPQAPADKTLPAASRDAGASAGGGDAARAGGQPQRAEASWIGRFLQWLGVEHERQAAARLADAGEGAARPQAFEAPNAAAPAAADAARAGETLKSALLALANSDDAPPQLREAAQNVAQQITGQQLLLSADRTSQSPMSHVTLFVPIKGQNGDTTATIHVQTRRGRKGEWDTDNCRLLFDLRMSHLGDTLVDVQVVDKVVSLRLLNDRPWVADMVESARDEAAAGLRAAGYQLLTLKTVPFPAPVAGALGEDPNAAASGSAAAGRLTADTYAAKPYKGVDYRA